MSDLFMQVDVGFLVSCLLGTAVADPKTPGVEPLAKGQAAQIAASLASMEVARKALVSEGAVVALLPLLAKAALEIRIPAAQALLYIATTEQEVIQQWPIVQSALGQLVVQPIAARDSVCLTAVAGVLGTVASLRQHLLQARKEMMASKILQHLVTLLDMMKQAAHPSVVSQARVIQGLAAFAASDPPTAGKVGDAALQQLLDAAGSPDREIQEAAVLCLEHLSGVPAHAAAILERVSLRAWVQLLRESSIAAVRMAVPGMLQRVLFGGNAAEREQRCDELAACNGIQTLLGVLPHGAHVRLMYVTEEVASAAGCLWLLARREEHRQKIAKHLPALKTLLESDNQDAKTWAAGICWMLALHKGNRTAMKNAGLLAPLVELVALPKKGKKGKKKGKKGEAAVRVVTDEATTRFHAIGALRSLTLEDPLLKDVLAEKPPKHLAAAWAFHTSGIGAAVGSGAADADAEAESDTDATEEVESVAESSSAAADSTPRTSEPTPRSDAGERDPTKPVESEVQAQPLIVRKAPVGLVQRARPASPQKLTSRPGNFEADMSNLVALLTA